MTALLAATFLALRFTAPADAHGNAVASYAAQRSTDHGLTWSAASVFSGPSPMLGTVTPKAPGATETLWVSVSTAPQSYLAGGSVLRITSISAGGASSPPSNWCAVTAGPDTLWMLGRANGLWKRGSAVGWGLAYGDSDTVRVWHQEQVQRGEAARLCRDYGYFDVAGVKDSLECHK